MARKDEFVNRDPPQLPADGSMPGADVQQASEARTAQERVPLGTPSADYTVRSVYDSRPVSAGDFNVAVFSQGCSSPGPGFFTVPQGYVAVLREVLTWQEPILSYATRAEVLVSLQANKVDVANNIAIPVGNGTDLPIKCFIIADENQSVGVRWESATAPTNTFFWAHLYGNLLLKSGRPAQFEIANYAGQMNITQPGFARSMEGGIPESASQVHGLAGTRIRLRRKVK
jgi:hypothetical protein